MNYMGENMRFARKVLVAAAALAATTAMAAPANAAITLATPDCNLTNGCLFTGVNQLNLQDSSIQELEDAFNSAHTGPGIDQIDLTGIFQSGQLQGMSGTFTWDDPFDYLIVKAGTNAVLWYTNGATEFDWNLFGFTQNEASHIVIYGGTNTAVPEPGTWAMMLMGFGAAGVAMRRRRRKPILQIA